MRPDQLEALEGAAALLAAGQIDQPEFDRRKAAILADPAVAPEAVEQPGSIRSLPLPWLIGGAIALTLTIGLLIGLLLGGGDKVPEAAPIASASSASLLPASVGRPDGAKIETPPPAFFAGCLVVDGRGAPNTTLGDWYARNRVKFTTERWERVGDGWVLQVTVHNPETGQTATAAFDFVAARGPRTGKCTAGSVLFRSVTADGQTVSASQFLGPVPAATPENIFEGLDDETIAKIEAARDTTMRLRAGDTGQTGDIIRGYNDPRVDAQTNGASGSSKKTRIARCRLVVDGQSLISGNCGYTAVGNGDFVIETLPGAKNKRSALVELETADTAEGSFWLDEEDKGNGVGDTLRRKGACWVNRVAQICAWAK